MGAENGGKLNIRIALDVPEEHSRISFVRKIGRTVLEQHDVATQDIADIEMIMGELCANVTRHARSEAGFYRVVLEHHETHVVLVVEDSGQGFDPLNLPPIGGTRESEDGEQRYGGFGLHLIHTLADRVEIKSVLSQGTMVRTEKRMTQSS